MVSHSFIHYSLPPVLYLLCWNLSGTPSHWYPNSDSAEVSLVILLVPSSGLCVTGWNEQESSAFLSGGMYVSVCLSNFRSGDSIIAGIGHAPLTHIE